MPCLKSNHFSFFMKKQALGIMLSAMFLWGCSEPSVKVKPSTEFEETSFVLLSEYLFSFHDHGVEFTKELLDADADIIVLRDEQSEEEILTDFIEELSDKQKDRIRLIPSNHSSQWVRDFGPLPIKRTYRNQRSSIALADFIYRDDHYLDDTTVE